MIAEGQGAQMPSTDANAAASAVAAPSSTTDATTAINNNTNRKLDPVTQVQDAIDSLSLSLFEALRGLRDATAPDSLTGAAPPAAAAAGGSASAATTSNTNNQSDEPDYEDFLIAYHNEEPHAVAVVKQAGGKPPKSREEYVRILARMEMESDVSLVTRLAEDILSKSQEVDDLVDKLPGMDRTKEEQMELIERLIEENGAVDEELESKYREAEKKRDEVRETLRQVTCSALGIEEES